MANDSNVQFDGINITYLNMWSYIPMCAVQESPRRRNIPKTVVWLGNHREAVRIHADNGHTQIGAHQVVTYANHVS